MSSILDMFNKYSKEILVGYFLILWGMTDLVDVIWGLYYFDGFSFNGLLDLLYIGLDLALGLVLVSIGSKVVKESK